MKIFIPVGGVLLALGAALSCKKTESLPPVTQSNIISFAVNNLPDTAVYGAIDNTDRTITIYLPFYYSISVIDPVIKVTDGAKIQEEIVPFKTTDTARYTVKGKDNSTTVYKAFVVVQPPATPFTLLELSTATNYATANPGYNQFSFGGMFYTTNAALTQSWLVNSKGVETPITGGGIFVNTDSETGVTSYWRVSVTVPPTLDSGLYLIKSSIWGRTATMQYPIHVVYQRPEFAYFTTRSVMQGETFTLNASVTTGQVFTDIKSFSISTNGTDWVPLAVESYSRIDATVRVPVTVAPGAYNYYRMEFNSWPTVTHNGSFTTIVAK